MDWIGPKMLPDWAWTRPELVHDYYFLLIQLPIERSAIQG